MKSAQYTFHTRSPKVSSPLTEPSVDQSTVRPLPRPETYWLAKLSSISVIRFAGSIASSPTPS